MSSITFKVCFPMRVEIGLLEAIAVAISSANAINSSGATHASNTPRRYNSAPPTRIPVSAMRRRREWLNSRIAWRQPPSRPTSTSGRATDAFSDATRMSLDATIAKPEPSAAPLIAQTTGLAHSLMAWKHSRVRREWAGKSPGPLITDERPFRSAPAQNTLPAPVRMTARTPSISEMRSSASVSSSFSVRVSAFTGGAFIVNVATKPSRRYSSWVRSFIGISYCLFEGWQRLALLDLRPRDLNDLLPFRSFAADDRGHLRRRAPFGDHPALGQLILYVAGLQDCGDLAAEAVDYRLGGPRA